MNNKYETFNKIIESIRTVLVMVFENIKFAIVIFIWIELVYFIHDTEEIKIFWKSINLPYLEKIMGNVNAIKENAIKNWLLFLILTLILIYIIKKILPLFKVFFINTYNTKRFDVLFTIWIIILAWLSKYLQIWYTIYWIILLFWLTLNILVCTMMDSNKNSDWFLLSDYPYEWWDWGDILNYKELADNFTRIILNDWAKESLVFSIESDWWNWKTSFIKLFKDNPEIKKKCIVFEFEAWHFNWETDLLEKFLNELKNTLNKKYYLPELSVQFDNLLLVLWEEWINKAFWIKTKLATTKTLEEIKNSINESLKNIDKKMVIIIDDIDRIPMNKAKILFRIIDLCRNFYNTSYILCYDNENFNSIDEILKVSKGKINFDTSKWNIEIEEEVDNRNVRSYLEKVVNIKYSLIPDINQIKLFFYEIFTDKKRIEFSANSITWIKDWIDNLFKLDNFEIFWKHLKNIRKIKRLYNFFLIRYYWNKNLILNIFDTKNNWLNFESFIKLSILNLFYDKLYCDIVKDIQLSWWEQAWYIKNVKWVSKYRLQYNYESWGMSSYKTPDSFRKYIETLTSEQKNILTNIFPVYDKYNADNNIDLLGFWNRLEEHIKLIESVENIDFNKYISDCFDRLKDTNENISLIVSDILNKYKAKWVTSLLTTIEKNISNITTEKVNVILDYIIDEFHQFSINSLASCWDNIARILDWLVWHENTKENCISIIWKYIYSDGDSNWIIDRLLNTSWWIKWIYNVISIRHLAERGSSLRNFQRWIVWREYELNLSKIIYFKKISRYIFQLFKKEYIDKNINIFKLIDELNNDDLKKDEWVNAFWSDTKNWIRAYIIYQLTNDKDWIWYYDINEDWDINNQSHWIKNSLNEYYFNYCFLWDNWIKYFTEYIFWFIYLPQFSDKTSVDSDNIKIRLTKNDSQDWNIFDVFEEEKINNFIETNTEKINNFIEIHWDEIFEWFNGVRFSYWFWWELFKKQFYENNPNILIIEVDNWIQNDTTE